MKAALVLSGVLNVVFAFVLCSLAFNGRSTLSAGVATRASSMRVVPRIAPRPMRRSMSASAKKQMVPVEHVSAPVAPGKVRIRVGAPLAAAAAAGVCNLGNAFPALAAVGKIFDFDLTLPYIATEVVLLSFFLDKLWFTPLGKLLDQRKNMMQGNLESAEGNLAECDNIIQFAEESLRTVEASFRKESEERLTAMNAECDAAVAATKERVNKEIDDALAGIEKDKQVVLSDMTKEIEGFCWEILGKALSKETVDEWKKSESKLFEAA